MYKTQNTHIILSTYEVNDKMRWEILIGIGILFLLIGSVAAIDIDDMKVPFGYSNLEDGVAMLNDGHTELYIGKLAENPGVFESNIEEGYVVSDIGNNTYYFIDDGMQMYGLQEKVNIDNVDYIVSVSKDSELSNADKTLLKEDLENFNELNNLKPLEVSVT